MKKLFAVLAAITFTAVSVNAQKNSSTISLGVDAGVPVGLISSNVFSFVIGGSLQADFNVSPKMAVTASAGYQAWLAKGGGGSIDYIPLLAGFRYHFTPKVYGSAQLGASVAATKGAGTPFTYIPGIGFQVSNNIDLLVKYTGLSFKGGGSFNNVGVRLAYSFGK